ncbi:SCO family protein [Alloyangia pacifica]|uniref:SCO family protein n=1 Tax=Alloyangia pacifica TaxID=311180 RepID=UPI001CD573FA|nr:SCO family protein [Alloyangia pacifica]MCA0997138.1 SCO family protein [Alloyangia pacifica]
MNLKEQKVALWLCGLAVLGTLAILLIVPRVEANQAALLGRGDYALTGTDGSAFTQDSLKGAPSAVFFGFTHCPEVCPTTMGDIATWKEDLPQSQDLRVFFVSVDPERDTPDLLQQYVSWVPGVTGVTGSPKETQNAIDAFRVYAERIDFSEGSYTMDHSAYVMLFDADGLFVDVIPYQADYDMAEAKLRNLLEGNPEGLGAKLPRDPIGWLCYRVQAALS